MYEKRVEYMSDDELEKNMILLDDTIHRANRMLEILSIESSRRFVAQEAIEELMSNVVEVDFSREAPEPDFSNQPRLFDPSSFDHYPDLPPQGA